MDGSTCVGTIVCKLAMHKSKAYRGYIAMLAVHKGYRKKRIGVWQCTRSEPWGPIIVGPLGH